VSLPTFGPLWLRLSQMYPRHGSEGQGLCFGVGTKAQLRGYSGRERKWEEEGKNGKKKGRFVSDGERNGNFSLS